MTDNNLISFSSISKLKISVTIALAALIGFNLLLVQFPLSNSLGYEFSSLNAVLLFYLSGLLTLRWLKHFGKINSTLIALLILNLSIPFLIIVLYSFLTLFCSFTHGVLFYLVITIPAVYLGFTLALFIHYSIRKFRQILYTLLFIFIALIPIIDIYFYPQVYFYNPIIAFFPGTIYDESLAVHLKMFTYRLFNIGFASLVIYLIYKDKERNKLVRNISIIFLCPVIFYFLSPYIGYSTNYSTLKRELDRTVEAQNFNIHYSEKIDFESAALVALHTQYYYEKLVARLAETPKSKIDVFIFNNAHQKRELFGSGNADVAKPWLGQVYINYTNWQGTLLHELAHIFSAEFGSTLFKLAGGFNPFLVEGFATSIDPFRDELEVDFLTSMSDTLLNTSDFEHLLTGFNFFSVNSMKTYTYAGSLCKYLIKEHGIERFKKYYQTNDFLSTYGIHQEQVIKDYLLFLSTLNFEHNEHKQNYYFGRKSITQKYCPRYIASQLESGWEQLYNGNLTGAKQYFNSVLKDLPDYQAIMGLSECYLHKDSVQNAIELIQHYVDSFSKTPFNYLLRFRLADLLVHNNQISEAIIIYNELYLQKPTLNLELNSTVRLKLHQNKLLKDYISGNDSVRFELVKQINEREYFYPSIPLLIKLAGSVGTEYVTVKKLFNKTFFINDFYSAYAVYKLSEFMIENYDFRNSRKFASLALRYKEFSHYNALWSNNFEKADWFYYNADKFIKQFKNGD